MNNEASSSVEGAEIPLEGPGACDLQIDPQDLSIGGDAIGLVGVAVENDHLAVLMVELGDQRTKRRSEECSIGAIQRRRLAGSASAVASSSSSAPKE